jgi:hypothetical protein
MAVLLRHDLEVKYVYAKDLMVSFEEELLTPYGFAYAVCEHPWAPCRWAGTGTLLASLNIGYSDIEY